MVSIISIYSSKLEPLIVVSKPLYLWRWLYTPLVYEYYPLKSIFGSKVVSLIENLITLLEKSKVSFVVPSVRVS